MILQFNNITDIYKQQLPDCVIKMKNIPPQLEDASAIKKVASFSQGIASAAIVVSLVVSPGVSRSLSPVWSLLNSLQFIVHAPIFGDVKFPGNTLELNDALLEVANFKILNF